MVEVRHLVRLVADELVDQLNAMRKDMLALRNGTIYHASATAAITTANATVDGYATSSVLLANACRAAYVSHIASAVDAVTGVGSHLVADSTNVLTAPVATDEASAITLVNDLKAKYNLHRVSTTFHAVADSTNSVSASDATDEASLVTLVNQIKAKLNLHFAGSFTSEALVLVDA